MLYVVTCAFIVLDFVTGLIMAGATGTFSSTVMREGLYKKLGLILCMVMGWLVDYAQGFVDLGVTIPVAAAICGYICVMEVGSMIENICKINPELMPERLTALFDITTGSTDEQTTTTTISDTVAAILEAAKSTTQDTAEEATETTTTETTTETGESGEE